MSDVLLYNAIKRNFEMNRVNANNAAAGAGSAAGAIAGAAAYSGGAAAFTAANATAQYGFNANTNPDTWRNIPRMTGATGGIKVCDPSGYYRCGCSCSWTVPSGVTCAEFQLWGHGGGTSSQCCCGGAPYGMTGAYAVVAIPVTAGDVYTICAGCAYCCYATQTTPGLNAVPTYVTGTGLNNLCAMGGVSDYYCWKCSLGANNFNGNCFSSNSPMCGPPSGFQCTPWSCSGFNFCFDDGTGDRVRMFDYTFSCQTKFYGTATSGTVYGVSGMHSIIMIGGMGTGQGHCGFIKAAPVYGFELTSQCLTCFCQVTCSGCNFAPGIGPNPMMCNPGSGGSGGPVAGGCNACGGDSGRMGMVCVSYK